MTTCDEKIVPSAASRPPTRLDLPPGVPPLNSLYVYAAGSCNLACRHCWITPAFQSAAAGTAAGKFVDLEHVRSAIEQGKPLGLSSIKLTGGEPTLHPRFRELVTLIAGSGLRIVLETNGTLVDDDLAGFLRQSGKISFISVSLDGAEAATHDYMRAVDGSFARAQEGIRALRRAGFRPQVICTLFRGNVGQIEPLIAMAEELGCESVKFNLIQEMGRGESFNETQGLTLSEIIALNERVENEILPKAKLRISFDVPMAFRPISRLLRRALEHCGVLSILGMLASGELSLCGIGESVPDLIYGHIAKDPLRRVWCESPGLLELRRKVPAELQGICGECLHRLKCLGSCLANNYHATGKLNAAYAFCARAEEQGLFPASRKEAGKARS